MYISSLIPAQRIEHLIYVIRGQKVMLDQDLAALYSVETKVLNQGVKRNHGRFPPDFMFQLTVKEWMSLRSQIVTLEKPGRGHYRKYLPYVFTEHGAFMAAHILKSPKAIVVSIEVVRAFIHLRQTMASQKDLAKKLDDLEKKYDAQFKVIFETIRCLMYEPTRKKRQIGFQVTEK